MCRAFKSDNSELFAVPLIVCGAYGGTLDLLLSNMASFVACDKVSSLTSDLSPSDSLYLIMNTKYSSRLVHFRIGRYLQQLY